MTEPNGIWKKFQTQYAAAQPTAKFTDTYLTNGFGWVIGPYNQLELLRDAIVAGDPIWGEFLDRKAKLGRREKDNELFGSGKPAAYKPLIANKPPEADDRRLRWQFKKADVHWTERPLEVHHILEDKTLEKIGNGLNNLEFARDVAPCVLLVAELHQRLITSELAATRHLFKGTSIATAKPELIRVYTNVYADPTMSSLQHVALKSIEFLSGNQSA